MLRDCVTAETFNSNIEADRFYSPASTGAKIERRIMASE